MIRWLGQKPERGVLYNQAARVCHRVRQQEGDAPVSVREEEKWNDTYNLAVSSRAHKIRERIKWD